MDDNATNGFWDVFVLAFQEHGVIVFFLLFFCLLFWQLIWKVWNTAIEAKNEEIERLVVERDKYQALVFEKLLSSEPRLGNASESLPAEVKE